MPSAGLCSLHMASSHPPSSPARCPRPAGHTRRSWGSNPGGRRGLKVPSDYSGTRGNAATVTTWADQEMIVPSEVSQRRSRPTQLHLYVGYKKESHQETNTDTDDSSVFPSGKGGRGPSGKGHGRRSDLGKRGRRGKVMRGRGQRRVSSGPWGSSLVD